jgi:hypothetical protein
MSPVWKLTLLLVLMLILAMSMTLGGQTTQNKPETPTFVLRGDTTPVFTAKDRELLTAYYQRLYSTLAPGSITQSKFSPAVERSLVTGSHIPMQLEKELEPLPNSLEATLSQLTGDYRRYKLQPHVVIVKKADLTIMDIVKNVGTK